ncbi:MAG: His/Gly/Thr/Pro-type tRNA ligase C-terminal domain-containing protein, partial [Myxococcota bacterium]
FGDEGSDVDVYVTLRSDDVTARTVRLASTLRAAGLRVDLHPEADKLRKQLSAAAERGARFATIMGAREVQAGTVAVKDLDAQEQTEVPLAEAADFIQARLSLRSTSIT